MNKPTIKQKSTRKFLPTAAIILLTFTGISHAEDIAFFEKTYETKIEGVKPLSEYSDPDSYYSDIARQLGIFEKAYTAVFKKNGWKKGGNKVHSAKLTRGGRRAEGDQGRPG